MDDLSSQTPWSENQPSVATSNSTPGTRRTTGAWAGRGPERRLEAQGRDTKVYVHSLFKKESLQGRNADVPLIVKTAVAPENKYDTRNYFLKRQQTPGICGQAQELTMYKNV